ncbi:hypothetical protein B296_00042605 [Ensete ventricosum]|uniref:beta-galactosidase n=1 Tax=Ensete ventricosum TaxID=4639 RepID=A0A426Z8E8_ENSVE|nr:hypothetical protein B296_00042605 [Ensete ventricosum]
MLLDSLRRESSIYLLERRGGACGGAMGVNGSEKRRRDLRRKGSDNKRNTKVALLRFHSLPSKPAEGTVPSIKWPYLIAKAREGGLDVIQTYVFWNEHEPFQGQASLMHTYIYFTGFYMLLYCDLYRYTDCGILSVQVSRKTQPGEVHQTSSRSRPVCEPQNRSFHRVRVEIWVRIVFRSDNEGFKAGACLQTHTISSSINLAIPFCLIICYNKSISILPGCKKTAVNTAKVSYTGTKCYLTGQVSAGYGERTAEPVQYLNRSQQWEASAEESNIISIASFVAKGLLEQMSTTKDVTDYLWCTTSLCGLCLKCSYNQQSQQDGQITLHVDSLARVLHVFVNGELLGKLNLQLEHLLH